MLFDQCETTPITTGQQVVFAVLAVMPDRADGMNDPSGREFVTAGDFGLAGGATAPRAAFGQQLRPGRPVDGAVHAATAEQRRVGGVDNHIHALLRNVAGDDGHAIGNGICSHIYYFHPQ